MEAWARDNNIADWKIAIGIRADEPDRIKTDPKFIYPLFHTLPTTKAEVNDWWTLQTFHLELPGYRGNCIWCWKKSLTKLVRIAQETPESFIFPATMVRKYYDVGPEENPNRRFFRGYRSVGDILKLAESTKVRPAALIDQDEDDGCSESCEVFS